MAYISFSQSSGNIEFHDDAQDYILGIGWAGHGVGKLNPDEQATRGLGPLPRGWYSVGEPFHHPECGPFALRLTPDPDTIMYGRDGFLIHGAAMDPAKTGQESKGCIVAARVTRERIHELGITRLLVIQ